MDHRQRVLAALEQYESRLMRFAQRLLRDEDVAHDAVQQTFLKLCDQRPEQIQDRLAMWLFTVCRNCAIDSLRQQGKTAALRRRDPASQSPDPALLAENHDLADRVRHLMGQLPRNQREVLELWLQGFSYRDIAEVTSHSEGHVRLLNHRALTRLRQHPHVRKLCEGQEQDGTASNTQTEKHDDLRHAHLYLQAGDHQGPSRTL